MNYEIATPIIAEPDTVAESLIAATSIPGAHGIAHLEAAGQNGVSIVRQSDGRFTVELHDGGGELELHDSIREALGDRLYRED